MNVAGLNITVGADPEFAIGNVNGPISAHGLIEGTKDNPQSVKQGAVQVDGMLLEFNIDPASSYEEFQSNLDTVQQTLLSMVDGEMIKSPSVFFTEEVMKEQPFEAVQLGCEADYNAYTGQTNEPPDATSTMRTAGGHVHIGGIEGDPQDSSHMYISGRLAKCMDEEVGIYSLLWDDDNLRRSMYGKAGCFRPKPYGMEYRTLSNAWLYKPQLTKFVYDGVIRAVEKCFDFDYEPSEEASYVINNSVRDSSLLQNELADQVRSIMNE